MQHGRGRGRCLRLSAAHMTKTLPSLHAWPAMQTPPSPPPSPHLGASPGGVRAQRRAAAAQVQYEHRASVKLDRMSVINAVIEPISQVRTGSAWLPASLALPCAKRSAASTSATRVQTALWRLVPRTAARTCVRLPVHLYADAPAGGIFACRRDAGIAAAGPAPDAAAPVRARSRRTRST